MKILIKKMKKIFSNREKTTKKFKKKWSLAAMEENDERGSL